MTITPLNQPPPVFSRGATIGWSYTFYDIFGNVQQPVSTPQIRINFPTSGGAIGTLTILMIPPGGVISGAEINTNANAWVAIWDSRGAGAGTVFWSIETPGSPPVSVLDGQFSLTANAANQPTF